MFDVLGKIITSKKFYLPIIYIAIGIILFLIISSAIRKVGNVKVINRSAIQEKRRKTIIVLINNIIKYIIAILIILAILNVYGINTTSIIASLGIAGVVVGLAFQDIVKDFLAGMFIIIDNVYAVGDWVEINGFTGQVIEFGLKTTKIKAYTGEVKIISNSSFKEVTNYNLEEDNLLLKIPISYNADIDKIEEVLATTLDRIKENTNVKETHLLGIDSFEESSMLYAVSITCKPMTYIGVRRELLKIIKKEFDKNKIEIPYSRLDVHIEK